MSENPEQETTVGRGGVKRGYESPDLCDSVSDDEQIASLSLPLTTVVESTTVETVETTTIVETATTKVTTFHASKKTTRTLEEAQRLLRHATRAANNIDTLVETRVAAAQPATSDTAAMLKEYAILKLTSNDRPAAQAMFNRWVSEHGWCFKPCSNGRPQLLFVTESATARRQVGDLENNTDGFFATHVMMYLANRLPTRLGLEYSHWCHFPPCCLPGHGDWETHTLNMARNRCRSVGECLGHGDGVHACVFEPHFVRVGDGPRPWENNEYLRALVVNDQVASSAPAVVPTTYTFENELLCHAPDTPTYRCRVRGQVFDRPQTVTRHELDVHHFDREAAAGYAEFKKQKMERAQQRKLETAQHTKATALAALGSSSAVAAPPAWTKESRHFCHAPGACTSREKDFSRLSTVIEHEKKQHNFDREADEGYQALLKTLRKEHNTKIGESVSATHSRKISRRNAGFPDN